MKEYYIISGLNLRDNNRGTAALSYGAFSFLKKFHKINNLTAICLIVYKKPWRFNFNFEKKEKVAIGDEKVLLRYFYIWYIDYWVYKHISFLGSFTKTGHILKRISFVATINGGDGFSDIYGTKTFENRLFETKLAIKEQIPLIMLPQTFGPFKLEENMKVAEHILKYANKIYVRDLKFESEFKRMGSTYELAHDLSYYMQPEKVEIDILPNAVGLNVSGLCYSNIFRDLSGRFDNYPILIEYIIKCFQEKSVPVYLISHSYNYNSPEISNDDMQVSKQVYAKLDNKTNVYLIDKDLTSPKTKYIISQFDFFIGTRMHANFAAIYTGVPVFGLAYSYKFEGAFNRYGLSENHALILDLKKEDILLVVSQIMKCYEERDIVKKRMIAALVN